jgi:uncharacterized SAM-binding protein YcdF (DUF218 family)
LTILVTAANFAMMKKLVLLRCEPPRTGSMDHRIRTLVETIWRYHQLNHPLSPADAILVLCSHDTIVAERGAELFLRGWAPILIFAGGLGSITKQFWREPEADQFATIATGMGVPAERILIENRSTNTGENILFTKQLLFERRLDPQKFILVQKPYMERRSYATFRKLWPEKDVIVTSPRMPMDEYLSAGSHDALSSDDVISIMVGDLQRIRLYPEKGFQIPQQIPDEVWRAYEELVRAGYDTHLITSDQSRSCPASAVAEAIADRRRLGEGGQPDQCPSPSSRSRSRSG